MSDLRLVPWCLIERFQSLAVPRPLACWNWFGVIHDPNIAHKRRVKIAAINSVALKTNIAHCQ